MNVVYKRIAHELKLIQTSGEPYFRVYSDPNNLLNVHFTFLGPLDSPFARGLYHGVIHLPQDYPHKPPEIIFLTNNGRFETNKYICTSFTSFHPESWNPTWGIRNIVIGLRSLFDEETPGSIGSITTSEEIRKKYAMESHTFICKICACNHADLVGVLYDSATGKREPEDAATEIAPITSTHPEETVDTKSFKADHVGSVPTQEGPLIHSISSDSTATDTDMCMDKDSQGGHKSAPEAESTVTMPEHLTIVDQNTPEHVAAINPEKGTISSGCHDVLLTLITEDEQQIKTSETAASDLGHPIQLPQHHTGYSLADPSNSSSAFVPLQLFRTIDNAGIDDSLEEGFRGTLTQILAGATVPSTAISLLKHMRENAKIIRADVKCTSNV